MICANMIAFGISSKATVSYDAEVEYLESTGTQWIDTGHVPTINTKWIFDCVSTPNSIEAANANANGCYVSTNKFRFSCAHSASDETKNGFTFATGSGTLLYTRFYDNERHIIELNNNGGNNPSYAKIDDNTYELQIVASVEGGNSILLFAQNATSIRPSKYKIYSSKIYEGDVLVQDLIPVIDNNGVACMYDNVSKQCFYNQGTGEFVAGPVKYWGLKFTTEEANSTIPSGWTVVRK